MDNAQALVERYLETFNETDPDRRAALLGSLYTAESTYTDPAAGGIPLAFELPALSWAPVFPGAEAAACASGLGAEA